MLGKICEVRTVIFQNEVDSYKVKNCPSVTAGNLYFNVTDQKTVIGNERTSNFILLGKVILVTLILNYPLMF